MTSLLGGQFTSRVNMNLREAQALVVRGIHIRVGCARAAAVHRLCAGADRQDQGVDDRGSIASCAGFWSKPVTADELAKAQANLTLTLPGNWETMGAVQGSLEDMVNTGSMTATSTPMRSACGA